MKLSRKGFIRSLAGLTAFGAGGCFTFGRGDKIRLAVAGVGGKGFSDWLPMIESGKAEIVAICDVDSRQLGAAQARLNKLGKPFNIMCIPFYRDYRRMIDDIACGKVKVDAMTVSTTDHMHAPIAISAMKLGINVYVQKPLVRTLWELDYFDRTARDYGVVTQMGNQASALPGLRRGVEILQSGVLGDVTELHIWTDRPVWPQGLKAAASVNGPAAEIPRGLDWDVWVGTAKERPYRGRLDKAAKGYDPMQLCPCTYHPFSWRGFIDFGVGAFGDMACHSMNLPFRGLELGSVKSAECILIEEKNDIAFPLKSTVKLVYPERESKARPGVKLPECVVYWYDGQQKPSADLMPEVVARFGKVPNSGGFLIGSKGRMFINDNGSKSYMALGGEKTLVEAKDHEAARSIPRSIPLRTDAKATMAVESGAAAVSANGHYVEFLDAINGDGPVFERPNSRCFSDIDYSVPLMEGILAGCIAQQVPGLLNWDAGRRQFDSSAANALMKPYIREGFEF